MNKDEALQMCLEYIETDAHERKYVRHAIKQALAAQPAPVQEPVAWPMEEQPDGSIIPVDPSELPSDYFTTPPAAQRPWVGLTDEVKRELIKNSALWDMHIHIGWYSAPAKSFVEKTIQLIADIEAKLKEKNT
jgi:hypothetical protein